MFSRFLLWLPLGFLIAYPVRGYSAQPGPKEPASFQSWVTMNQGQFACTNQTLQLVGGNGWLRSDRAYTNFVLELEWRALDKGYDSGIFLRAGKAGSPWPTDAWQVNLSSAALGALVKGYRSVVRAENPPAPLNQWVKMKIEVVGTRVTLHIDGEQAWTYNNLDAAAGYIGIQAEGKKFEFRNLQITVLEPNKTPAP